MVLIVVEPFAAAGPRFVLSSKQANGLLTLSVLAGLLEATGSLCRAGEAYHHSS